MKTEALFVNAAGEKGTDLNQSLFIRLHTTLITEKIMLAEPLAEREKGSFIC